MAYRSSCNVNMCKDSQQTEVGTPIEIKQGIAKARHQVSLEQRQLGKIRTGYKQRKMVPPPSLNRWQLGRRASISSPHTPSRLCQEPALPSLLKPAKISTFITTLCFRLTLSQASFKILVELFISIFTAHL